MCYYMQAVRTNGFLPQKPENCTTGMRGWRNWQTRTFEVRVVYPWGFESPPSHQKASRFLTCLFFYEQKWWNGRHAGFRHQFLVSEGSSPFFCTSEKTRSSPEGSGAACGSFCLFMCFSRGKNSANLRESPLKRRESPRGCLDRLFCGMV